MAYVGTDYYLAAWAPEPLCGDQLSQTAVLLLGDEAGDPQEEGFSIGDLPRGFIVRDWFGPFLLGPASRFVRGRC